MDDFPFQVGQLVRCVRGYSSSRHFLEEGNIYTVEKLSIYQDTIGIKGALRIDSDLVSFFDTRRFVSAKVYKIEDCL